MSEKLIGFFAAAWRFLGTLWTPVWLYITQARMDWLIIMGGSLILFLLGIWLQAVCRKKYRKHDEKIFEIIGEFPGGLFWLAMVMKIFYPLLVAYLGMLFVRGTMITGGEAPYRFDNYAEWIQTSQVIGGVVMLQLMGRSAVCLIRFKPLRLLKFWVHSIDFALIGAMIGTLYVLLLNGLGDSFFGGLLLGLAGIVLDIAVPCLFCITALAPVYCFIYAVFLAPILRFIHAFDITMEFEDGDLYAGNTLLIVMDALLP